MTAPGEAGFVEFFTNTVERALTQAGASVLAYFITENSANNFPALPVREGENVLGYWSWGNAATAITPSEKTLELFYEMVCRHSSAVGDPAATLPLEGIAKEFESKPLRELRGFAPNRRWNARRNASAFAKPTDSAML